MSWSLDNWIKGSADGRATTQIDNQEAWAGAYEGKFEVDRSEGPISGDPFLKVTDKDATEEQIETRDLMDGNFDEKDEK